MATLIRCDSCRREPGDGVPGAAAWWRLEYAGMGTGTATAVLANATWTYQFCSVGCLHAWSAAQLPRTREVRPAGEGA